MSEGGNGRQSLEYQLEEELRLHCKSELLSKEGLREIIESHELTPNNNNNTLISDCDFFRRACHNERVTEGIIRYLLEYFPNAASAISRKNGRSSLHYACFNPNERVTEGIIRYLLEYFPDAANATDDNGWSPLHVACINKSATVNIIRLLTDAAPTSLRSVTNKGSMPLHILCDHRSKVDEETAVQILKLLIEKYPESVRHVTNRGCLPIHRASESRSREFCRVLLEAYPGSERITDEIGALPLHWACYKNNILTVEYLFRLYPDAINHVNTNGGYPIHAAIRILERDDPLPAVDIVQFLLDCDPNVKLQTSRPEGESLLETACQLDYDDSNIGAALEVMKIIYDAHPEAIEDNNIASNIQEYHRQVQSFINGELVYSRQAKDHRRMITPDANGQLPLHRSLQNNVRLGSMKLLVKGNPCAIRNTDKNFAMPLHVACQHHNSASVIQYLLDLDVRTLRAVDIDNNTALHYACRGAKYEAIALLLEKYDALSVSKQNAHGKLPINLLWESNAVEGRESVEYTESIFRLLKAYPEMVMTSNAIMKRPVDAVRKKRKLCHGNEE